MSTYCLPVQGSDMFRYFIFCVSFCIISDPGPFGPHRPPWPRTDDSLRLASLLPALRKRLDRGGLLRGAPHRRIAVPLPTHGLARLRGPSTDVGETGPKGRGMGAGMETGRPGRSEVFFFVLGSDFGEHYAVVTSFPKGVS